MPSKTVVGVLSVTIDKQDYSHHFEAEESKFREEAERVAGQFVYKLPVRSKYNGPVTVVQFTLAKQRIVEGQLQLAAVCFVKATAPVGEPTPEEYDEQLELILGEVPLEFGSMIRQISWDRGHSSGYIEVLSAARELVEHLKPAVAAYATQLLAERANANDKQTNVRCTSRGKSKTASAVQE